MKKLRNAFNFVALIKYVVFFGFYYLFCYVYAPAPVFSVAPYATTVCTGNNLVACTFLFLLALFFSANGTVIPAMTVCAVFFITVNSVYHFTKRKIKAEIIGYTLISLLGYIFMGEISSTQVTPLEKRIIFSLISVIFTYIFFLSYNITVKKGVKFKLNFFEIVSLFSLFVLIGLGITNGLSPTVYKCLCLLIIFFASYIYRLGITTLIASVLGVSFALYYKNVSYVSLFTLIALVCESSIKFSKYLGVLSAVLCDLILQRVFHVYSVFGLFEIISDIVCAVIFLLVPNEILKKIKDKLFTFREKQLVRQSINQNRTILSNKLYEISNVFSEMSASFNYLNRENGQKNLNEMFIKNIMNACREDCPNFDNCTKNVDVFRADLLKALEIGVAKGKLSFIDIGTDFFSFCLHPNTVIFSINKQLSLQKEEEIFRSNINVGREIIAGGANAISSVLKNLALESGTQLKYSVDTEKELHFALSCYGFNVSEILCFGDDENYTVSMVLLGKELPIKNIQYVLSKVLNKKMVLHTKNDILPDKCYLQYVTSTNFDAIYGVSTNTKDGEKACGDSYSVMRICENKFLVAISDGMGSGETAQNVSSVSLSLIESFYKAGIDSDIILPSVNKLLSVNLDENFTALDICVIDLNTKCADIIKYGAPYGYVIRDNGIQIIEGNTLPLGIISDLTPSVLKINLLEGDVLVLMSDGVSDAFGSSSDIIDFFKTEPALNPQTLANNIMKKALIKTGGAKNDDMTCLCVRLIGTDN